MSRVTADPVAPHPVPLGTAARVWAMIGCLGFGGPAGQIALMHRELVERRRWIDEARFLHALNYCMLLPGPEAQQLATYLGWLLHRTRGGLVAGALFVLPGCLAILGLAIAYVSFRDLALTGAVLFGLKAAVLGLVVDAIVRVGRRALTSAPLIALAVAAWAALFFFAVPFPAVVIAAALVGAALGRRGAAMGPATPAGDGTTVVERLAAAGALAHTRPSARRAAAVIAIGAVAWAAPLAALAAVLGRGSIWFEQGVFFSQLAVVTFGGAYAALAYVAQHAVTALGWLSTGEMIDALGLAETTPGPLILVVEFVAFLGGYHHPGSLPPLAAGALSAAVAVWVTFVPCFVWIFLGAPYVESIRAVPAIRAGLAGITAAVVGVIASLSLWFALHVVFARVGAGHLGPLAWPAPVWSSVDVAALVLAIGAGVALVRYRIRLILVLAVTTGLGAAWRLAIG